MASAKKNNETQRFFKVTPCTHEGGKGNLLHLLLPDPDGFGYTDIHIIFFPNELPEIDPMGRLPKKSPFRTILSSTFFTITRDIMSLQGAVKALGLQIFSCQPFGQAPAA